MYDGTDTVILYEELAYHDALPLQWRPLPDNPSPDLLASYADSNVSVLQTCLALDEHSTGEKLDETAPHSSDLFRLDLKINLLLDLVGKILASNQPRPKAIPVRFNAIGASFRVNAPLPQPGSQGMLEIYLRDVLADPLKLFGRVAAVSPAGDVNVKFLPVGEAAADLIEKLAFRRHRRRVAGTRQPRRNA